MKPFPHFLSGLRLWAAAIALSFLTAGLGHAQVREFKNGEGKSVQAEVTSATAENVTLKLADGREITAALTYFSKEDQEWIGKWRQLHPVTYDYRFKAGFGKKRDDRRKTKEGSLEVVYEDWFYEVKLENAGRQDLANLELQYRIYATYKADARGRSKGSGLSRQGKYIVTTGQSKIASLPALKSTTVKTAIMHTAHSELLPGWYYADGSKDEKEDEIEGIWVKVFHNGKEVFSEKNGSKALDTLTWGKPGAEE